MGLFIMTCLCHLARGDYLLNTGRLHQKRCRFLLKISKINLVVLHQLAIEEDMAAMILFDPLLTTVECHQVHVESAWLLSG